MIKVNVGVSEKNWKKYIKKPDAYIAKRIKKINDTNIFFKNKIVDFSLMLSGNNEIKSLNKKFRKKNKITYVLSFPFYEKKTVEKLKKKKKNFYLGDVIINLQKVENKKLKIINEEKFNKLWIHGFLHLIGNTHKTTKAYLKMDKLEKKVFNLIK